MHTGRSKEVRFGLVCNGNSLLDWQIRTLRKLLAIEGVHLALVIAVPDDRMTVGRAGFKHLLFHLYRILLFRPQVFKAVDATTLFSEIPRIEYGAGNPRDRVSSGFSSHDLDRIRGYDLDFILCPGQSFPQGEILSIPRFGVWAFHPGDNEKDPARPSCFSEIFRGDPVTGPSLERMMGRDSAIVLRRGYFRNKNASFGGTVQLVFSEISRWPAQACLDIQNGQGQYLDAPPSVVKARTVEEPNNRETILFLARLIANRVKGYYRLLFRYSVWNIGLVKEPIDTFLEAGYKPQISWLPVGWKGEFKADPFGLVRTSNLWVFYENLDYHRPKGVIFAVETLGAGYTTEPRAIIELPVHMSYPYLLEYKGETYCIPETNHAREIIVYRAVALPFEWEKAGTLLRNVAAIDTTVFQHQGRWWMFFTDREKGGDANLYVWYAPDFWGPWQPHANNPVKSDVQTARPGGTPFYHGGELYRPVQDCSETGGGRLVINRVKRLDPDGFEEEPVAWINPDKKGPYPEGLHTLSKAGDYTLVDGKRFEFVAVAFANNIMKGLRRLLGRD